METPLSIEAFDGKQIHAFLHTPESTTDTVIVLVHGLTGHMNEYIHIRLAQLITQAGYAVIRFNQYGDGAEARLFHESTIRLHVADTQRVLGYAAGQLGYPRRILVGHSLGAPVAIAATDAGVAALILLDPSGPPNTRIKHWQTYDPIHHISYLDWSQRILLGEPWIADAKTFPDSYEQFATIACPVHVIAAERAEQLEFCRNYSVAHPSKPEVHIIPDAGHCFTEAGAVEHLGETICKMLSQVPAPR